MKMPHLTKRESDVMEVFWNNDRPLAVGDIQQVISEITSNSIQPVLKKLQKKGFIHVSGISQNKKTLMREYLPSITKAEYVASLLDKDTFLQVASTFVQNNGNDDEEFISALRQLIDQEIKE